MSTEPRYLEVGYPGFKVILCSMGASVYSIKVNDTEMLSTFEDKDAWAKDTSYHGKTLGRIAGRIPQGKLVVGKETYQVEVNERGNTLHGGANSLTFRNFDSSIKAFANNVEVTFTYTSPDGEAGFPGNVTFEVIYRVYNDKRLEFIHRAKTDKTTAVDLSNHCYFNLGVKNLDNMEMMINTPYRYHLDDNLLRDAIVPVKGTSYDFREPKQVMKDALNQDVAGPHKIGFDDIWYYKHPNPRKVAAILESPRYRATFYSDYNAAVVYMCGYPSMKKLTTGNTEEQFSAITMEFMDGDFTILKPHQTYQKYTMIQFEELNHGSK